MAGWESLGHPVNDQLLHGASLLASWASEALGGALPREGLGEALLRQGSQQGSLSPGSF